MYEALSELPEPAEGRGSTDERWGARRGDSGTRTISTRTAVCSDVYTATFFRRGNVVPTEFLILE